MGSNKSHLLRDSQQPTDGGTGVPSAPKMVQLFSQNLFHHVFCTLGWNEKKDWRTLSSVLTWYLRCHITVLIATWSRFLSIAILDKNMGGCSLLTAPWPQMPSIILLLGFKQVLHRCSPKFTGTLAYNGYSSKCPALCSIQNEWFLRIVTEDIMECRFHPKETLLALGEGTKTGRSILWLSHILRGKDFEDSWSLFD